MIPGSKTFLLTIQRNAAKFNATMAHLKEHGVEPTVFLGMDGDISGLETRWPVRFVLETEQPIFSRWVSLYFSQYMLWKTCSYQPHDAFVILEDDVRLDPDWKLHLESAMNYIEPTWDILFIGSCCTADKDTKVQISYRLWEVKYANCTHAYAIRKKAIPFLLEKLQRVDTKLDIAIAMDAMPHLKCFAILPRLAEQEGTFLHP